MHDTKHHHHHHGHHHGHGNHNHNDHPHESAHDLEKFIKRIEHWKHHNEDHLESYREWAIKAEEIGLKDVSELLNKICLKTEEQNALFEKILDILKSR
ncbi:MAG: hypothetical protein ACP5TY_07445 [Thermodesulforhabdaceae bacterium]